MRAINCFYGFIEQAHTFMTRPGEHYNAITGCQMDIYTLIFAIWPGLQGCMGTTLSGLYMAMSYLFEFNWANNVNSVVGVYMGCTLKGS